MIKDLQVDRDLIFNRIAANLNKEEISVLSSIYKITEPVITELESFAQFTNNAIKDLNINSASLPMLQKIGSELNVFRQNFNSLELNKQDQAVSFKVEDQDAIDEAGFTTGAGFLLFSKNYSTTLGNCLITFLEDVYFTQLGEELFISARLTLTESSFYIPAGSLFTLLTQFNNNIIPSISVKFLRNVGLSKVEETIEDFRLKLLNVKELPFKNVNSILQQALQELPLRVTAEIANSVAGVNSHTVYLKTTKLLRNGFDSTLEEFLIPAYRQAVSSRLDYTTDIIIDYAKPLLLSVQFKKPAILTNSNTDLAARLNEFLQSLSILNYDIIATYLSKITNSTINATDVTVELKAKNIFEANLKIDSENSVQIPAGRFFHVIDVLGV